jgi:hypothetical protein
LTRIHLEFRENEINELYLYLYAGWGSKGYKSGRYVSSRPLFIMEIFDGEHAKFTLVSDGYDKVFHLVTWTFDLKFRKLHTLSLSELHISLDATFSKILDFCRKDAERRYIHPNARVFVNVILESAKMVGGQIG